MRQRRSDTNRQICPACRQSVDPDGACLDCPRCGAHYHQVCLKSSYMSCLAAGCSAPLREQETGAPILTDKQSWQMSSHLPLWVMVLGGLCVLAWLAALITMPNKRRYRNNPDGYQLAWQAAPRWPWRIAGSLTAILGLGLAGGNLVQAKVLAGARPPRELRGKGYGLVAFEGLTDSEGQALLNDRGEGCIYLCETTQVLERDSRGRRRWRTESQLEYCLPFTVEGLRVCNQPTEIYGCRQYESAFESGNRRKVTRFLPCEGPITVVGHMIQNISGPVVDRDPQFGMLLSAHGVQRTLLQESAKVLLFVALAGGAAWLGFWI
jgi:hypothetical protein